MAKKTTKKKAPKRSSATKSAAAKKKTTKTASKTATKTVKKSTTKKKATTVKKKAAKKTATVAKKAPAKKRVKRSAEEEVKVDRRTMAKEDRREDEDRRQLEAVVETERREAPERRTKVARRRQIDPTTCERDYSNDEIEFMHALDDYKRKAGRMFPTCSEILEVIRDLGYRRLTPEETAAIAPLNPTPEVEALAENGEGDPNFATLSDGEDTEPLFGEPVSGFPTVGSTAAPAITDLAVNSPSLEEFEA